MPYGIPCLQEEDLATKLSHKTPWKLFEDLSHKIKIIAPGHKLVLDLLTISIVMFTHRFKNKNRGKQSTY